MGNEERRWEKVEVGRGGGGKGNRGGESGWGEEQGVRN